MAGFGIDLRCLIFTTTRASLRERRGKGDGNVKCECECEREKRSDFYLEKGKGEVGGWR